MKKQQNNSFAFRGTYFFLVVLLLYGVLFLINSTTTQPALLKSVHILVRILPIFVVVILFTALLNYFLQPRQIAGYLGRESGYMGWLWALAGGVISHGPMYAWYPLLENLRSNGMRDELIVVFFASRTIKIPLLPIMIDHFGLKFTVVLSFYILIGALLQGYCYGLPKRSNLL
ncbi:MAG TPA: permease [Desulfobulbus sp.]|nr:permease [Desulfobulbus sp.]